MRPVQAQEGQSVRSGAGGPSRATVILFPTTLPQADARLAELREDFIGWNMTRRLAKRRGRPVDDLADMLTQILAQYRQTKRLRADAFAAAVASARLTITPTHEGTT